MKTPTALVILSGGQDSTTCLYWAKEEFDDVHAVTFDYGQRHRIEIAAAQRVAQRAGVKSHGLIRIPAGMLRSTSPLLNYASPLETYSDYATMDHIIGDRVELTFVPMRNALFLTLAANYAVAMGAHDIVIGVCEADNANYPDCRKAFIDSQERTIREALGQPDFKIHAPLLTLSKANAIAYMFSINALEALEDSHTCYAGEYPPCGKCHACVLRAEGFRQAGVHDPLMTRAYNEASA